MKRIVIVLVLGSLLALSVASGAAAKQVIVGQLNGEVYPDSASTLTVIDQGSRLSARLRAIDAIFYPDSFGSELRQMADVGCEAPTTDQCFGSGV
jgi:hypothetical protein